MTTPAATSVPTEVPTMGDPEKELTAEDRCDRCGAQAYVRTRHANGVLLWCAHHFNKNDVELANKVVVDNTASLA